MKYLFIGLLSIMALTSCQSTMQSFAKILKGEYAPEYDISEQKTFVDSYQIIFPKQNKSEAYKNINFIFSRNDSLVSPLFYNNKFGYHYIQANIPGKGWDNAQEYNLYDLGWMGTRGSLILSPKGTLILEREYCHFHDNIKQNCMVNSLHDAYYVLSSDAEIIYENDKTVLSISNIDLDLRHDERFKTKKMELQSSSLVNYTNNFLYKIRFSSEYSVNSTLATIERTGANKMFKTGVLSLAGEDILYNYTVEPYKHGSLSTFSISIPSKRNNNILDFNYATKDINTYFDKLVKQELI